MQPAKACDPITWIKEGNFTEVKRSAFSKAEFPMMMTPSGKSTFIKFFAPYKKYSGTVLLANLNSDKSNSVTLDPLKHFSAKYFISDSLSKTNSVTFEESCTNTPSHIKVSSSFKNFAP